MPRKWTNEQYSYFKNELLDLYVRKNKSIKEIGSILNLSEKTIYKRLIILNIKTQRLKKEGFSNRNIPIKIPKHNASFAEFIGIMLGDGKLAPMQIFVTLGNKEDKYIVYVQYIIKQLFGISAKVFVRKNGYKDVYFNSVIISRFLQKEGLVFNKVKSQVGVPDWIFSKNIYCKSFLRGFFDTDGSIYQLKYGYQISFTNCSMNILKSLQKMLSQLEYNVSEISSFKVYITKRKDVLRFFKDIKPKNSKHLDRFKIMRRYSSGQRGLSVKQLALPT